MRGEGESRVTSKLKKGAHIHQPTAWPLPHACAQPYQAGCGSHGQLFRPVFQINLKNLHVKITNLLWVEV